MKKTLKFFGSFIALSLLFFACKDDLSNDAFMNGTATVYGTAIVNLDISNDTAGTTYEYVPQGTHIYARINSEDLVEFPSAGVNYGDIIYDTVVGASGAYTFVVAANTKNVTVSFFSDDFMAQQVQADESFEPTVFYLPEIYTVSVIGGSTRIIDLNFLQR